MIKSISYDQQQILNNILSLYHIKNIDLDPCYNLGYFYKNGNVVEPKIKGDINPLLPGVIKLDVTKLNYENLFKCIIFDPPFIVGGKSSKMGLRYGSFEKVIDLIEFIKLSFISLQRALKNNGILIFKCQDFVNGRKNYCILNEVLNMARDNNFVFLDLFILLSKTRPIRKYIKQQYARKYHCYFIVLRLKKKNQTTVCKKGK